MARAGKKGGGGFPSCQKMLCTSSLEYLIRSCHATACFCQRQPGPGSLLTHVTKPGSQQLFSARLGVVCGFPSDHDIKTSANTAMQYRPGTAPNQRRPICISAVDWSDAMYKGCSAFACNDTMTATVISGLNHVMQHQREPCLHGSMLLT